MKNLYLFEKISVIFLLTLGFIVIFVALTLIPEIMEAYEYAPILVIYFMIGILGILIAGILIINGAAQISKKIIKKKKKNN